MALKNCDFFGDGSGFSLWKAEDNTDTCGNYNLTWEGTEQYSPGIDGNAFSFDGTNSLTIRGGEKEDFKLQQLSVSLWVTRLDYIQGERNYIFNNNLRTGSDGSTYNSGNSLEMHPDGGLTAKFCVLNSETYTDELGNELTSYIIECKSYDIPEVPFNATYTIDNNTIILYINGVKVNSTVSSQDMRYSTIDNNISIGNLTYNTNTYYPFNGDVDQIRVFNKVLSESEVQEVYQEFVTVLPDPITDFQASDDLVNKIECTWTTGNNTNTVDIYRDNNLLSSDVSSPFEDTNITPETTYEYYVKSINDDGEVDSNTDTGLALQPLTPPQDITDLSASDGLVHKIVINWTDYGDANQFDLYRNNLLYQSNIIPGYEDTNIVGDTTYEYYVIAINDDGETTSNTDTGYAIEITSPPAPITDFTASDDLEDRIQCNWTDNGDVETFIIYKNGSPYAQDVQPGWYDTLVQENTLYEYRVMAVNSFGSVLSNPDTGKLKLDIELTESKIFVKNQEDQDYINLPNGCGLFINGVEPQVVIVRKDGTETVVWVNGVPIVPGSFTWYQFKETDFITSSTKERQVKDLGYTGNNGTLFGGRTVTLSGDGYIDIPLNYYLLEITEPDEYLSQRGSDVVQFTDSIDETGVTIDIIELSTGNQVDDAQFWEKRYNEYNLPPGNYKVEVDITSLRADIVLGKFYCFMNDNQSFISFENDIPILEGDTFHYIQEFTIPEGNYGNRIRIDTYNSELTGFKVQYHNMSLQKETIKGSVIYWDEDIKEFVQPDLPLQDFYRLENVTVGPIVRLWERTFLDFELQEINNNPESLVKWGLGQTGILLPKLQNDWLFTCTENIGRWIFETNYQEQDSAIIQTKDGDYADYFTFTKIDDYTEEVEIIQNGTHTSHYLTHSWQTDSLNPQYVVIHKELLNGDDFWRCNYHWGSTSPDYTVCGTYQDVVIGKKSQDDLDNYRNFVCYGDTTDTIGSKIRITFELPKEITSPYLEIQGTYSRNTGSPFGLQVQRLILNDIGVPTEVIWYNRVNFSGKERIETGIIPDGSKHQSMMIAFTLPRVNKTGGNYILNTSTSTNGTRIYSWVSEDNFPNIVSTQFGNYNRAFTFDNTTPGAIHALCYVYNTDTDEIQWAIDGQPFTTEAGSFLEQTENFFLGAPSDNTSSIDSFNGLIGEFIYTDDLVTEDQWFDFWNRVQHKKGYMVCGSTHLCEDKVSCDPIITESYLYCNDNLECGKDYIYCSTNP